MQTLPRKTLLFLSILGISVYIAGLPVTIMDIDAAQYASIAREMSSSGNYLTVLDRNHDYLDKPPLLFWLTALSFNLFGVSTIAYKLPSFLFVLFGFYATFRLGARLFGKRIGILSAVILSSCQAFIFFTNDVRTDALLSASVIITIWQIVEFINTKKARHYFLGVLGVALAMLAKGPIGLMVPLIALGSFIVGRRDYRMLFQWKWIGAIFIVLALISPMLWGLYRQFGLAGIKFYFWTQSFGRLTGENVFKDSSGYFFFVHTFLWAFLPWMLLAYYGIGVHVVRVLSKISHHLLPAAFSAPPADRVPSRPAFQDELGMAAGGAENAAKQATTLPKLTNEGQTEPTTGARTLLLGGVILPFIALSCSHYKLPHYIFVIFPLVAILTAQAIDELIKDPRKQKMLQLFTRIQFGLCIGMWLFALVCMTLFFPCKNFFVWAGAVSCAIGTLYFAGKGRDAFTRLVMPSLVAILGVNLMLNTHFFPTLLTYQSGSSAAKFISKNNIPLDRFFAYHIQYHSMDFYTGRIIPNLDSAALPDTVKKGGVWVYTEAQGITLMRNRGFTPVIVDSISHMHITKVTARFLFNKTRENTLGKQYIARVDGNSSFSPEKGKKVLTPNPWQEGP
jgi:4-amino-4-deoxy-L-arabinose transferase-like glycosyltransferase